MQKAHVYFSPLEVEYRKQFGMYPDLHYHELCEMYGSSDIAAYVRQQNMDNVYKKLKEEHMEMVRVECPFIE